MHKLTNSTPLTLGALVVVLGLAAATAADDVAGKLPPDSTRTGVTYATDIKPILQRSCIKCHSGDKPKAKLRLDTLANVLKGSKHGKVIIPGHSARSKLVLNAAHLSHDHDQWMPPKRFEDKYPPLTPAQIGLIRAWIDQGAK